ncbi:hypothetical protein B0H16DRAFT_1449760 [Mycena metata]|uniref:Hydrophobin n=1 Tax=Mycena metata TaxID=1033252 RepID=A0AAD7NV33_9AGAR|nr:hypothetical protein B0H16DRAFT_1449760 [Mycena metata]
MKVTSTFIALIAAVAVSATPLTTSDDALGARQSAFCAIGGVLSGSSIRCDVKFLSACGLATYQSGPGTACCQSTNCTLTAFTGAGCSFTYTGIAGSLSVSLEILTKNPSRGDLVKLRRALLKDC